MKSIVLAAFTVASISAALATGCADTTPSGAGGAGGAKPSGTLTLESFTASEKSSDVTSTLIEGPTEAILVDAQFLDSEAKKLVTKLKSSGKKLTRIYITHAHPDHSFGLAVIQQAFPDVEILANSAVAAEMKSTGQAKQDQWTPVYGDDITKTLVPATAYDESTLMLEGHTLQLIGPKQGDVSPSFIVYIPELTTLITGDVSYNGTHVWLAETDAAQRKAWVQSLKDLQALEATTVISGHRDPTKADAPQILEETITYIQDFDAAVAGSTSADEVIQKMTAKYPDRVLPDVLKFSAGAMFGG